MFYELSKKFLRFLVDLIGFFQVSLVFLSFFTILYWILQLAGVEFSQSIMGFFEGMKDIVHTFYTRVVVIDGVSVDFSFLVAVFIFLIIAWFLRSTVEYIDIFERKLDVIHIALKEKEEMLFNEELQQEYVEEEYKNNKIVMIMKFKASDLKPKDIWGRNNEAEAKNNILKIEREILKEFSDDVNTHLNCKIKNLDDSLIIHFDFFSGIDKIFLKLENIILLLKQKYKEEGWKVSFFMGLEAYSTEHEVDLKTQKLIKLIDLTFKNKIACFSTFKQRYSLIRGPKYDFESQGCYEIIDGEEIFIFKRLK